MLLSTVTLELSVSELSTGNMELKLVSGTEVLEDFFSSRRSRKSTQRKQNKEQS